MISQQQRQHLEKKKRKNQPQLAGKMFTVPVQINRINRDQIIRRFASLSLASREQKNLLAIVPLKMHIISGIHPAVHTSLIPCDPTLNHHVLWRRPERKLLQITINQIKVVRVLCIISLGHRVSVSGICGRRE